MRKFDTKVQYLKYKVLREVARRAWDGLTPEEVLEIPKVIVPGKTPTMRCCVYKERAILGERVKLAMGGNRANPNIIEVIDIACDECPAAGYEVTGSCRGCLANRCEDVCKRKAISFDHQHVAHIDKSKCVECGQCAKVCPFGAIVNRKRPCQLACKIKAIDISPDGAAAINDEKCIQCGACVYQCPFGAIQDKSFIMDVISMLVGSQGNTAYKVYAIVAPAFSSQFSHAKVGQAITGMKQLGFHTVIEAALGADLVAMTESQELVEKVAEKGAMTSSCCPAFVRYIRTAFPELADFVSHNLSPMAALAKYIKSTDPTSKVVFIGPCTAKKAERQLDTVKDYVDAVMTFEELRRSLTAGTSRSATCPRTCWTTPATSAASSPAWAACRRPWRRRSRSRASTSRQGPWSAAASRSAAWRCSSSRRTPRSWAATSSRAWPAWAAASTARAA